MSAVGIVLLQDGHPVAFESKKLKEVLLVEALLLVTFSCIMAPFALLSVSPDILKSHFFSSHMVKSL